MKVIVMMDGGKANMSLEPCCGCGKPVKFGSELYCEDCSKILNDLWTEEGWEIVEILRNFWDGLERTN